MGLERRYADVLCDAIYKRCSLNVINGSGRSRRNFFSSAASCTGLSDDKSTVEASRSMTSVSSFSRLILPFFRKMPSTDMSVYMTVSFCKVNKHTGLPICRIAETTSSIKLGTLKVDLVAPSNESAPSLSTRSSRGTPKTPKIVFSKFVTRGQVIIPSPFFFTFFLSLPPLNSLFQKPPFFTSTNSRISSRSN